MTTEDPIVAEIHAFREKRAKQFKHNIDAMFEDLRRWEERSKAQGAIIVQPPERGKGVPKPATVHRRKPLRKRSLASSKP